MAKNTVSDTKADALLSPSETGEKARSMEQRPMGIIGKIRSMLGTLFDFQARRDRRPRRRVRGFGGMEQLEARTMMSASPALIAAYDHVHALEANPVTETVSETRDLLIDFGELGNGMIAENAVVMIDGVRVQLWTSNNLGITVAGGAVSSGADGRDHIIEKFVDGPVLVSTVDMRNLAGTTGGKINLSLGDSNHYVDLPASGMLTLNEPVLCDTVSFLALSGRGAGFEGFGIRKTVNEVRMTDAYMAELSEARTLVAGLEAEEGLQESVEPKRMRFEGVSAGNLQGSLDAAGVTLTLPEVGSVQVQSGGSSPIRVTEGGGLETGVNGGHLVLHFATPTYVESMTVKQSGGGVRKYNVGDGYKDMRGLTKIPVGKVLSEFMIIVYDDAAVEVQSVNLNDVGEEETPIVQSGSEGVTVDPEALVSAPVSMRLVMESGDYGQIQISSPYDASYVSSLLGNQTIAHVGGGTNVMIQHRHLRDLMPANSRTGVVKVYADAEHTKMLMELTLDADPVTGQVSMQSAVRGTITGADLPGGFDATEVEEAPEVHIAMVEGPNVIVAVSGLKDAEVRFAGVHDSGALSSSMVKGGEGMKLASLTINTSNPTGDYAIIVTDRDGKDLGRQNVHWDWDTKQLSLIGGSVWNVPEGMEETVGVAVDHLHEMMRDPGIGDRTIGMAQAELLSGMTGSLPAPYNTMIRGFDEAVQAAHPEWSDEGLRQKAIREHGSFTVTQAFEGLVRARNDEMRLLRSAYGTYTGMVGDLLKQASTLLSRIRSGGDEMELRHAFAVTVSQYAGGLAMYQLSSIGIRMPDADTLLECAKCLWDQQGEQLLAFSAHAHEAMARQTALIARGYVTAADGTLVPPQVASSTPPPMDPKVAAHNARVIAMSEGIGSVAERLAAYAAANGLSAEFVQTVTGVDLVASVGSTDAQIGGVGLEKYVSPEGDLLTVMNRTSLTRILGDASKGLLSAEQRGDTDRILFFTAQRDAAQGLLDLIPEGSERPVTEGNAQAEEWKRLLEKTTSDPASLGEFSDATFSDLKFHVTPGGNEEYVFTLTETAMVNVTMPGNAGVVTGLGNIGLQAATGTLLHANFTIEIRNAQGASMALSSRDAFSGDAISVRLPKGTYTLVVSDGTSYPSIAGMSAQQKGAIKLPEWHLDFQAKHFNSANIEGVMSIDGNASTMPVRMRVANFYPGENGQRNVNYDLTPEDGGVQKLDPTKPVWVVIHGREDKDDSGKMLELEKALTESGYQVVSIDWREAAGENLPASVGMQGEAWIQAVGDWGYRALVAAGIKGGNIRVGVHSWGSFVGYEIAEHFKAKNGFGVDTIVALDTAKDPTSADRYDASQVNFAAVSKASTAFHSSFWGSEGRSMTAQHVIEIGSPIQSNSPTYNQTLKHGLAVTTFANLILLQKIDPSNAIGSQFIFSSGGETGGQHDKKWLTVETQSLHGSDTDDVFVDAVPDKMTNTDPYDTVDDVYTFNHLKDLHSYLQ